MTQKCLGVVGGHPRPFRIYIQAILANKIKSHTQKHIFPIYFPNFPYVFLIYSIYIPYIRHRAARHQWSVSNAVGVCQVACMVVLQGDNRGE